MRFTAEPSATAATVLPTLTVIQGPAAAAPHQKPRALRDSPSRLTYTCPMHPEIVRDRPGSCPICGMALEPTSIGPEEDDDHELLDMSRRFWVCVLLSAPLVLLSMAEMVPGLSPSRITVWPRSGLAAVPAGRSGRSLGRTAILRAGLEIDRQPKLEYVYAHCSGNRDGIRHTAR